MMRLKKFIPLLLAFLIGAAAGILFITPGFQKRTDVYLQDFSVSEDGSVVTLQTFTIGSMGYIRAMETKQVHNEIHCSFYRTFGGLNSRLGAEDTFEIQLDDSIEQIYLNRAGLDQLVLERDAETGEWAPVSHLPQ